MSVKLIIEVLTELVEIHDDLIRLSKVKTEILKEGSINKLQDVLNQEQKYVQSLEKTEIRRQKQVDIWCESRGIVGNITITEILENISDQTEALKLEQLTITLTKAITHLKQQEQLNQELISQSMQFVQLSLDMMSPTIQNLNYGNSKKNEPIKRSIFDSKA